MEDNAIIVSMILSGSSYAKIASALGKGQKIIISDTGGTKRWRNCPASSSHQWKQVDKGVLLGLRRTMRPRLCVCWYCIGTGQRSKTKRCHQQMAWQIEGIVWHHQATSAIQSTQLYYLDHVEQCNDCENESRLFLFQQNFIVTVQRQQDRWCS